MADDLEAGAGDDKITPAFLQEFNAEKAAIEKTIESVKGGTGA